MGAIYSLLICLMFMGLCSMDRIWSQASLSMSPLHWVHVWLHKLVKPGLILLWFVSLYLGWHHFIFPSGEPSACHLSSLIFLHYDLDAPPPVPHSHSHILTRAASTLAHPNPWRTTAVGLSLLSHPLLQICDGHQHPRRPPRTWSHMGGARDGAAGEDNRRSELELCST